MASVASVMRAVLVGASLLAGCGRGGSLPETTTGGTGGAAGTAPSNDGSATGMGGAMGSGGGGGSGVTADGCPDIFSRDTLSAYSIDIGPDDWAALTADFMNIQAVLAGTPPETYRPIVFHYGSETVANAAVRLKGQSSWVDTVSYDVNPKMQFVVAFDQTDPKGSFHGVSKIDFDMPRGDWTFLNERISNTWFRQIGILAPCSNSGTMTINGAFYGLYVTEQTKGSRLIKEFFPNNPHGDFFKGGQEPDGSDTAPNFARKMQFWNAQDMGALLQIVDLPNSLLEWAAEAVLNDSDGYYGGSHNFYIYDQGAAGYVFLPTDKDSTIEWMSIFTSVGVQQHPIFWWEKRPFPQPPGQHYLIVMNDLPSRAQYADDITTQLAKWDVAQIQGWIDAWSRQVQGAMDADPHKWATPSQFRMAVATARDVVAQRPQVLRAFVDCEHGMPADDKDGDGVAWCNDCADDDPTVHPGATEICGNNVDDDCNGVVDENCPGEQPGYPGQMTSPGGT